jgi:hypothetical protein
VTFAKVEGGDHELPRLDGEKVGDRGDRGGADPEVTEYGWPRDIDGNRAVGRPSPAAAGWVLPSPQVGWQLASAGQLGHAVDAVIDSGDCGTEPTTVIDFSRDTPEILRRGAGDTSGFE